jgi:hypothetical protein
MKKKLQEVQEERGAIDSGHEAAARGGLPHSAPRGTAMYSARGAARSGDPHAAPRSPPHPRLQLEDEKRHRDRAHAIRERV